MNLLVFFAVRVFPIGRASSLSCFRSADAAREAYRAAASAPCRAEMLEATISLSGLDSGSGEGLAQTAPISWAKLRECDGGGLETVLRSVKPKRTRKAAQP